MTYNPIKLGFSFDVSPAGNVTIKPGTLSAADVAAVLAAAPTSASGLANGAIWLDGGLVRVVGAPASAGTGTGTSTGGGTGTTTGTGTGGGTTPTLVSPAFFVAASGGSDSNAGTAAAPFATLAKGLSSARASSSTKAVYLRGGTYGVAAPVSLTSADAGLLLSGYPGETAILDGGGTLGSLISMDGAANATLQKLQLQRTARTGANGQFTAIVQMINGANNNKVLGCRFTNCDEGVLLVGATYNTVAGCVFDNWRIAAVEFKDNADHNTFDSNSCDGALATNDNNETSGGAFYGHGVNYNTISHNLIQNTPGTGISIANFDGPTQPIYTINTYNTVSYNKLVNCCRLGADTGAIYTVGRAQVDTHCVIEYNYIDGAQNPTTPNQHVLGIYIDDEANGVLVQNNIMRRVQDNCMQYHGGRDNIVRNNIFDMGSGACTATLFQAATYAPSTETMTNNQLLGNIMYSTSGTPTVIKDFDGGGKVITGNLYFNTTGASMTANQDTAPKYGDPKFANAVNGDYSFLSGSAALSQISFTPIDQSLIGLKPTTPTWY